MKPVQKRVKKKIILADDDLYIRRTLREALEEAGYEVTAEATNGLDLLEQCKKHSCDLVIVDIEMPGMDGISAAHMLLEDDVARCVVVLTAFDSKEYISDAITAGVHGYLKKPIDRNMLFPTLQSAMEKSNELFEKRKDLNRLIRKRQEQKYIDKAKLYLMAERDMSEEEAYRCMKDMSKRHQKPMEHIAKIIVSKSRKK